MNRALVGALSGLMLTATVTASAQETSLAAVAKQERARRAGIDEKSKVYTNDDLRGGPRLTTGTPALAAPSIPADPNTTPVADAAVLDGSSSLEAEPGLDESDIQAAEEGEAYWRNRIMTARDERQRAELMAEALQNRVDGLWADFTARDDPFQRAEIGQDRIEALEALEQTKADVNRLDQEIRDTQEEARRAGVPPGWLR